MSGRKVSRPCLVPEISPIHNGARRNSALAPLLNECYKRHVCPAMVVQIFSRNKLSWPSFSLCSAASPQDTSIQQRSIASTPMGRTPSAASEINAMPLSLTGSSTVTHPAAEEPLEGDAACRICGAVNYKWMNGTVGTHYDESYSCAVLHFPTMSSIIKFSIRNSIQNTDLYLSGSGIRNGHKGQIVLKFMGFAPTLIT